MKDGEYRVKSIGYVKHDESGFYLKIADEYRPALKGLEGFNYINVLFWCHMVDNDDQRAVLEYEKPYRKSPEKLGVFSTRSPARPNPIALTPVFVFDLDAEKGIIRIPFIDADNDTPIIDLRFEEETGSVKSQ